MTGAVYGGTSSPGNPAPFVETGAKNPPKKFSKIKNPYLLATFMDSFSGSAVYSPSVWPLDTDTDNDGIEDSNYEASVRGIISYNWAKPKVHNENCNVIFADGRSDTLKFRDFTKKENPIWGKPFYEDK
jgi:prepilin-type processing-associated H-X9-DG protein